MPHVEFLHKLLLQNGGLFLTVSLSSERGVVVMPVKEFTSLLFSLLLLLT